MLNIETIIENQKQNKKLFRSHNYWHSKYINS